MEISVHPERKSMKPYPKLMGLKDTTLCSTGFIVLFNCPGSGVVIYTGPDSEYKVGQHFHGFNMDNFVEYEGSLEIKN